MKPTNPHLTKAFYDGDFDSKAYFTLRYNTVPSSMVLTLYPEEVPENVCELFDPVLSGPFSLELSQNTWRLNVEKTAEERNDRPTFFLFESETHPVFFLVNVNYYSGEFYLELMYGLEESAIQEWALSVFQMLRKEYGKEYIPPKKTPFFSILAQDGSGGFYTLQIDTKDFGPVDIGASYNDDFEKVNTIVGDAIRSNHSGLILLHGKPGTGKTSYIKHLISKFAEKEFIFIQNDLVQSLLMPAFISFLTNRKNSILIIEDAERVIMPREASGGASITSTILQLTDGLFSDYLNIKVICTFNSSLQVVDKALLRKGRLLANYEFRPLAKEKANALLSGIGGKVTDSEMTLADIYNQEEMGFEEDFVGEKVGFK